MSVLYPYVDEELAAELEAQGIEVVDCRVTSEWGDTKIESFDHATAPRRKRATALEARARRSAAARIPTITAAELPVPVEAEPTRRFTTYDWLMMDPNYREAAERGKKIHEAALVLSEEKGITYEEAIEQVEK